VNADRAAWIAKLAEAYPDDPAKQAALLSSWDEGYAYQARLQSKQKATRARSKKGMR